jgi:hypothetical protein
MILIKNTANQVIYTKLINVSTGRIVSGEASGSITGYISKDGSAEASVANAVSSIGHGIYKLTLSQSETNCDSAVVNITHNSNADYIFESVYFQTTETNPSVNVNQNNDKTGYSLSSSQTFSTTGSVNSVTDATTITNLIKSTTYDGVAQSKLYEMILAFISGKVVVTSDSEDTRTISYKKRDGSTETFRITVSTADGSRSSGGTLT